MFDDRWALVTGAAHGIGRATAHLLARRGARLVLCDLDGEALDALGHSLRTSGTTVLTYQVDVGHRGSIEKFAEWAGEQVGALDLLVNNAGVLELGALESTSWEAWEHVLQVNLWGVVHCSRLFVPAMRRRGRGHVVNVASAAGEVALPSLLAYTTSKFAVVGFSHALRAELAATGVGVSVVCPGLVKTHIGEQPRFDELTRARLRRLLSRHGLPPERVAQAILRAAERNLGTVPVGAQATALHWARRAFSTSASAMLHRLGALYSESQGNSESQGTGGSVEQPGEDFPQHS